MMLRFERYFSRWLEKYLSKRSLIKHICSWRDKLFVLWTPNRQGKNIFTNLWNYLFIILSVLALIERSFLQEHVAILCRSFLYIIQKSQMKMQKGNCDGWLMHWIFFNLIPASVARILFIKSIYKQWFPYVETTDMPLFRNSSPSELRT